MRGRLTALFVEAADGGAVATLEEIMTYKEFEEYLDDPLGAIQFLIAEAKDHEIEIAPSPLKVAHSDPLVFRRIQKGSAEAVGKKVLKAIAEGETARLELKSTLWLHVNRRALQPTATPEELKSLAVCNSSMKTICGFLNEDGGTLVIGVADDTSVLGIEEEYYVACPSEPSLDGWMKALRSAITQFFYEYEQVLNQIQISHGLIDGRNVIMIEVTPRRKLSLCLCKEAKNLSVYSRKGSSTEPIKIEHLEQYITDRNERLRSI